MYCENCGLKANRTDKFCINCGAVITSHISNNYNGEVPPEVHSNSNTIVTHTIQKKSKWILPLSILLSVIILGGFLFAIQVHKQKSIEKQQEARLKEDREQKEAENDRAELKLKQDECDALSAGVKKRWNNVMGVTYDNELWNECVVTYTDTKTGKVETSPLRFMEDN